MSDFFLRYRKIIIIALSVLVSLGLIVVVVVYGLKSPQQDKAELEFWSVFDDSDIFKPLIEEFRKSNRQIKINYYKKSSTTYESELINALAAGRGPDIFAINNTWLPKHIDKIYPMPEEMMTIKDYRDTFVEVASDDFVSSPPKREGEALKPERIYSVPLFVDTLALYWNKDIFNSAGIAQPPKNWEEFVEVVKKTTKKDISGNILQCGAIMGTVDNINRYSDILSLLMLQTGAVMVDQNKTMATFDRRTNFQDQGYDSAAEALRFYTDFANPSSAVYTWNPKMDYSIDAFSQGKCAMMINYQYHLPTIKAKEPHLRFDVAPVPQPKGNEVLKGHANYWGLSVAAASLEAEKNAAWTFVKWLSEKAQAQKYLESARRPTSRRDLVTWQQDDLELGVFARQSLSAKSWYQIDNLAIETIFGDMIKAINYGQLSLQQAVDRAAQQITLLMQKKNY